MNQIKEKYPEFTELFIRKFYNKEIQYGIIKGSNKIVFIKPGQDGSLIGYKDKYYNLAKYINNKYGYTVICSNNPYEAPYNPIEDAVVVINEYASKMNFEEYEVYYFGNSRGAELGARYGYLYPVIKRMLLINPPLFINFHKIQRGLLKFNNERIVFIYGSLDPSYKYVGLIDLIGNIKISYKVLEGEDHNLSNGTHSLEYLVDNYLINE